MSSFFHYFLRLLFFFFSKDNIRRASFILHTSLKIPHCGACVLICFMIIRWTNPDSSRFLRLLLLCIWIDGGNLARDACRLLHLQVNPSLFAAVDPNNAVPSLLLAVQGVRLLSPLSTHFPTQPRSLPLLSPILPRPLNLSTLDLAWCNYRSFGKGRSGFSLHWVINLFKVIFAHK